MIYRKHIHNAISYIEENLFQDLSVQSCARHAGYSVYYFHRIFKGVVGMTLSEYIRKRRLTQAAKMLTSSDYSIIDIAFQTGYNSSENFSRSFKKEHGISPSNYRRVNNCLHLLEPFDINLLHSAPRVEKVYLQERTIYCSVYETSPKERHTAIPRFWNQYHRDFKNPSSFHYDYGLLIADNDTYAYMIGHENHSGRKLNLPGGCYLKFYTPKADAYTFVETIHQTWDYIFKYLEENKIVRRDSFAFERYIEASKTYSEEIFIPIKERK